MNKPTKEEFQAAIKVMDWSICEMTKQEASWPWWKSLFIKYPLEHYYKLILVWVKYTK